MQMFNTYITRYVYALNTKGLKAGSVYALDREYALNNEVRLTTRVYGSIAVVWYVYLQTPHIVVSSYMYA